MSHIILRVLDNTGDVARLREEMLALPGYRDSMDSPGWRDLVELAPQLMHAPQSLGQHVGGMVLSSFPIPEMVPVRAGAIDGRYIMDWNKDSVADANLAKIDLLFLPVLDQLEEALDLIEEKESRRPDLGRIDPDDPAVYDMINQGRAKGGFLLQSPAQLKMGQRLRSRNLLDLVYQVALIRPGVGVQGSAVSQFVDRYRHGASWEYDHPLERGYGIIVWQEQVVQLIMDVAGMTAAESDEIRRAFARPNNEHLIAMHRRRFLEGARKNGVPEEIAERIFAKINGQYMFPESRSHAFAVTAYQAAWAEVSPPPGVLRRPGQQPTDRLLLGGEVEAGRTALRGALPESLREPQRRGLHPQERLGAAGPAVREGSGFGVGKDHRAWRSKSATAPTPGRRIWVRRTGLKPQAVESLVMAGAFDSLTPNRRKALWDAGLGIRPARNVQRAFPAFTEDGGPPLADFTAYEKMAGEYRVMGIFPGDT